MSTLAVRGMPRRWISRLHRWSGLFMMVFLLVAGVTGAALSFRWEIDRTFNPHLFAVIPQARPMPYQALIDIVEKRFPQAIVSNIVLPKTPGDSAMVYLKARMDAHVAHVHVPGMKSSVDFNQIFLDPYGGEILGQRSTTRFVPNWEHLVPILVRLHFTLFVDEWGAWLMGACAVVWFIASLVGLVLAWPAPWRSWRAWKPLFSLDVTKGSYRLNYRLHRLVALGSSPVLLVVAFSSIYMNWPGVVRPAINAISPLFSAEALPLAGPMDMAAPRTTIEQAILTARNAMPDARVHSVGRDFLKGLYSIRLQLPDDVSPGGNNTVFVRMSDGRSVFERKHKDASAGDVFLAWQRPLHTGGAFGRAGQWLVLLGALALVVMCVTGFNVWRRRRRGERRVPVVRG